jgi:hypothetical protein
MPQEISRPNSSIRNVGAPATRLTYGISVNPSPLTVSLPSTDPTLGSLVVVITNSEGADVQVQNITFYVPVGGSSNTLTPSSAGIQTAVSDTVHWVFRGPSSPVNSGTADYVLGPATGTSVTLAAGASVVVQLYEIRTNTSPGTATITFKEMIAASPSFGGFSVTTFPYGFYFESLAATMLVSSALVPVSQVAYGSQVTLTWNSSVVDTTAYQIYYSTLQGQQGATPTSYDQWMSPPLHSDTVFTVVVTAAVESGQPITASLSTSVAVTQPDLVANTIGIGNPDPKNKLHVGSGQTTITQDRVSVVVATKGIETGIAIAQEGGSAGPVNLLVQASGAGAYIGTTSNHSLVLRTSDADRLNIDKDGKLHIGSGQSTISRDKVDVVVATKGTDTGIAIAQEGGSSGPVNLLLQASAAGAYLGTTSNHTLILKTSDADRVSIDKDGTLTANNGARIAGQLTAPGPISMFGSYQGRQANTTYVAATDGIVYASTTGASSDGGYCCVRLNGNVNGQWIGEAMGGTVGAFRSDWGYSRMRNSGSITFPVPKGASWMVGRWDDPGNQTGPNVAVFWLPLGTTQTSADDRAVQEIKDLPSSVFKPREDLEPAIVNLVDVIETILKQSLSREERAALVNAVRKLI